MRRGAARARLVVARLSGSRARSARMIIDLMLQLRPPPLGEPVKRRGAIIALAHKPRTVHVRRASLGPAAVVATIEFGHEHWANWATLLCFPFLCLAWLGSARLCLALLGSAWLGPAWRPTCRCGTTITRERANCLHFATQSGGQNCASSASAIWPGRLSGGSRAPDATSLGVSSFSVATSSRASERAGGQTRRAA